MADPDIAPAPDELPADVSAALEGELDGRGRHPLAAAVH